MPQTLRKDEIFRLPNNIEMDLTLLDEFLDKHASLVTTRYNHLNDLYMSDHDIYKHKEKPNNKPDNRIVVNFAKYIVDTLIGFFIGNPIKISSGDSAVDGFLSYINRFNDQDDNNAELSKICSIYGKGYEMYYTDNDAELCITYLTPLESFMIFDDSILERPLFFVRRYKDRDGNEYGSISDSGYVRYFKQTGGCQWISEWEPHYFDGVPAVEYIENAERQSIFEAVIPMINAYDKAISEKANDVDYFSDAYMKILGAEIDENTIQNIRDNRIINIEGNGTDNIVVEFLQKPDGDSTQENLINRLERLIYQISMVANISDENFGTSSGIAMKYKLQAMNNLAKTKERKFTSGMSRRYKILFSHPRSKVSKDAWINIQYTFTYNIPANVLEESQTAQALEGVVSKETQLKVLSVVDNVTEEIKRLEADTEMNAGSIIEKRMIETQAEG